MNTADEAMVTIYRFDPTLDAEPRHEIYKVPNEVWSGRKVIDVIRYIYENLAPGLSYREPCGHCVCGACAILLNKKQVLACATLAEKEMLIEPPADHRVIKDLAVEL